MATYLTKLGSNIGLESRYKKPLRIKNSVSHFIALVSLHGLAIKAIESGNMVLNMKNISDYYHGAFSVNTDCVL